jgi:hypothetical protein
MKTKITIILFALFVSAFFISCEKQIDEAKVMYRIINFQDGFTVSFRHLNDTLEKEIVTGPYTLATPWQFTFMAQPGDIVYVAMTDTVENSFSRVQILLNGKIYKEKSRSDDRFMPVVVSGVVPFE